MNHIILCEGSTDYVLLQYYMREAYHWIDDEVIQSNILKINKQRSRNLRKGADVLTLMSVGGCSRFSEGLKLVLEKNYFTEPDLSSAYSNIVIITDRDEVGTQKTFINTITKILGEKGVTLTDKIDNNTWIHCKMKSQIGVEETFHLLLMIIPFDETGAMETFLLNAIGDNDPYDKTIIQSCNDFVEQNDPARRYLTSRRNMIKAKFDTYFSIRTPATQFQERQNILKNIPWEEYTAIQDAFQKLGEL